MIKKSLITLAVVGVVSGCVSMGGHHGSNWSYEGDSGSDRWGSLSEQYVLCSAGKSQSPVNITGAHGMGLTAIEFNYLATENPEVINNGHTIQVNYSAGSYVILSGKRFDLLQFHFHSPSENQIEGEHADMVAHLVHRAADGQLAVVAVLFDVSRAENSVLTQIWEVMPSMQGNVNVAGVFDVNALLPDDKGYYNFSGSLTTPPCSENVNWNVLSTRVEVSQVQVDAFTSLFPLSIRPVQPLNGRMIGAF